MQCPSNLLSKYTEKEKKKRERRRKGKYCRRGSDCIFFYVCHIETHAHPIDFYFQLQYHTFYTFKHARTVPGPCPWCLKDEVNMSLSVLQTWIFYASLPGVLFVLTKQNVTQYLYHTMSFLPSELMAHNTRLENFAQQKYDMSMFTPFLRKHPHALTYDRCALMGRLPQPSGLFASSWGCSLHMFVLAVSVTARALYNWIS